MSAELIKNQQEQIDILKQQVELKNELIEAYKNHCNKLQSQFNNAMTMLDEAISLGNKLSEKTTTN